MRFVKEKFSEDYNVTVGVEFMVKQVELKTGEKVALQLWDTAGNERFKSVVKSFFRESQAVILCYSVAKYPYNRV